MQENTDNIRTYDDEQDIDIMELISKLWKHKHMIIKWCIAGAVIGLIIGFSIPKTYVAGVTFAPETQQKTNSSVSSIASMMGVSLNNSIDAISVDMFPDVVHSTPFIVELFDLPVTFERNDSTLTTSLVEYMKEYQKRPWWSHVIQTPFKLLGWCMDLVRPSDDVIVAERPLDPTNLPKKERGVVNYFAENLMVNVDKKTGKISMSLEMQDPKVVAAVMDAITENLKKYMSDYRTSKARQDVKNLSVICEERKKDYYTSMQAYADFVDSNKNLALLSAQVQKERLEKEMNLAYQVYSQVATQLEGARIQEQQAKPVFAIIHPVTVPIYKAAPSKLKLLIIFFILAGALASAYILLADELADLKSRL